MLDIQINYKNILKQFSKIDKKHKMDNKDKFILNNI
jgi:hypothetical protein